MTLASQLLQLRLGEHGLSHHFPVSPLGVRLAVVPVDDSQLQLDACLLAVATYQLGLEKRACHCVGRWCFPAWW